MDTLLILWLALKPWLLFLPFAYFCIKMVGWAKNRKAGALAFGLFFQMFLPDPRADITIKSVVERKQEAKKQQDENGDPLDPNKGFDISGKGDVQ